MTPGQGETVKIWPQDFIEYSDTSLGLALQANIFKTNIDTRIDLETGSGQNVKILPPISIGYSNIRMSKIEDSGKNIYNRT